MIWSPASPGGASERVTLGLHEVMCQRALVDRAGLGVTKMWAQTTAQ